jgi:hypothetical protein
LAALLSHLAGTWLANCGGSATFYAWYDGQAGQLRFSLSSSAPADLPFGGAVRLLSGVSEVVQAFARDSSPGLIAWEDLAVDEEDFNPEAAVLPVWAVRQA